MRKFTILTALLLAALLLLSSCNNTVTTEPAPSVPSASLSEEQRNAVFEVLKANYFTFTISEYSDAPDAIEFFKPEGERVGALYNLTRDTGEKLDVYENESVTLFGKEYTGSCWSEGWNEGSTWSFYEEYEKRLEGTLCYLSYSFDKYLVDDEDTYDNKGFTFSKWLYNDSLAYFRLPAAEVKSDLVSAKELTEESAIAYAKDILSSLSVDTNDLKVEVKRWEWGDDDCDISYSVYFSCNGDVSYRVLFDHIADHEYKEQVSVFLYPQKSVPAFGENLTLEEYENRVAQTAYELLKKDMVNEDCLLDLEVREIVTFDGLDHTVRVCVYYEYVGEKQPEDDLPSLDLAVQMVIVLPNA